MKLIVAATLVAYASAFTAPTMATRAVKKVVPKKVVAKPVAKKVVAKAKPVATKPVVKAKPVAKKVVAKPKPVVKKVAPKPKPVVKKVAPKPKPVVKKVAPKPVVKKVMRSGVAGPSIALPFEKAPSTLDGSLLGDFGFDPLGFSTVGLGTYFEDFAMVPQGTLSDVAWYREAELMHGRIAQLAVVGFIWPALFGTIPGNDWTGADAFSYTNPLEEYSNVPFLTVMQIVLFMAYLENRRVRIIKEDGASHMPGDSRWGQGPGRYNPFNLDYTPEEYAEKQLQELKHCRLAMVGIFGLWAQASNSGVSVVDQLSAAFTAPDYYAKAGYFLPEGI